MHVVLVGPTGADTGLSWNGRRRAAGLVDTRDTRLRNGDHGYGAITKTLHWLTVLTIGGQFAIGHTMETDGDFREAECDPPGEDRSGRDTSDAEEQRSTSRPSAAW